MQAGPGACRRPAGPTPRRRTERGRACTLKNYRKTRNITAGTAYSGRPNMHADDDHAAAPGRYLHEPCIWLTWPSIPNYGVSPANALFGGPSTRPRTFWMEHRPGAGLCQNDRYAPFVFFYASEGGTEMSEFKCVNLTYNDYGEEVCRYDGTPCTCSSRSECAYSPCFDGMVADD